MKESRCPRCGEIVVFEDYGDNPSFLSAKCEGCGLKGEYLEGSGFTWEVWDERELRVLRVSRALNKAIQSESAKYSPCVNLLNAYNDGLDALKGLK